MTRKLNWSSLFIAASVLVVALESLFRFPIWLLDLARAAQLVEAAIIVVITLLVARRYFQNFRRDPTKARLLPRHVVRLGLGTVGLAVAASSTLISRIGNDFVWYGSTITFPALTIMLVGLWDMVRWLPNRTAPPTNDGRREEDRPGHNEGSDHA